MKLYDSATRITKEFKPARDSVTMYSCGITPYDASHLGHAAVFLVFDLLGRVLSDEGYEVQWVRNITDVDDSILEKARQLKVNYLDLAATEIARFDSDMAGLGINKPFSEPRATSAISDILLLIQKILDAGCAYQAGGGVYFDVSKAANFGEVSHLTSTEMLQIARERGGNVDDPFKRQPLDFVLWQPSLADEPSWDSRHGPGRPGWHIECSALAMRDLGETIDIHGGGYDLLFPHHECEAAQSQCITGKKFVNFWVHVGMVYLGGHKMSKSLGNLVFVGELLKSFEADAVRLSIVSNHYREHWEWNESLLKNANDRLASWRDAGHGDAAIDEVKEALRSDLNTPAAISVIDDAARRGFGISKAAALLGVNI